LVPPISALKKRRKKPFGGGGKRGRSLFYSVHSPFSAGGGGKEGIQEKEEKRGRWKLDGNSLVPMLHDGPILAERGKKRKGNRPSFLHFVPFANLAAGRKKRSGKRKGKGDDVSSHRASPLLSDERPKRRKKEKKTTKKGGGGRKAVATDP